MPRLVSRGLGEQAGLGILVPVSPTLQMRTESAVLMLFPGTLMSAHTVTGLPTHRAQPSAQPRGHRGHNQSPVGTAAPALSAGT